MLYCSALSTTECCCPGSCVWHLAFYRGTTQEPRKTNVSSGHKTSESLGHRATDSVDNMGANKMGSRVNEKMPWAPESVGRRVTYSVDNMGASQMGPQVNRKTHWAPESVGHRATDSVDNMGANITGSKVNEKTLWAPESLDHRVTDLVDNTGTSKTCPKVNVTVLMSQGVQASDNPEQVATITKIRADLLMEYADVFDSGGPLKEMSGPPMRIELQAESIPFCVNGARPIPFAQRDTVKGMLDDMEKQGIILPVIEPTDWTHPLVVVTKPNGKLRLCVDLTKLNKFVKRPIHPLVSPKDAISNIACGSQFFTTFDAVNGYWQIPLEKESQLLTTFITSWGRYKFLRGPMGLISTGDEFCRRTDAAIGNRQNSWRNGGFVTLSPVPITHNQTD